MPIAEKIRAKLFLWCARHCCFCGKACTTNMHIHHIDANPGNNDEDNLIPVCFDCHGELGRYNPKHPVGSDYKYLEIKTRRDQIYEQYTLPYLRQVDIRISRFLYNATNSEGQRILRQWGDVSCTVLSFSRDIPVRVRLCIVPYSDDQKLPDLLELYSGDALWNLNAGRRGVLGHFRLGVKDNGRPLKLRVELFWSIIDILGREHKMLPFSYVWTDPDGEPGYIWKNHDSNEDWWYDPRVIFYVPETHGE